MKKIFYILASAIVALGAVACENDGLDNIGLEVNGDTVSFIASIDNNRTDLNGLETVWDTDDTIVVEWNGTKYNFTNAGANNKNIFSCSAVGLSAIKGQGQTITATYSHNNDGNIDSNAGTAGALLTYEGPLANIKFAVQNAFLKFTAEEGAEVKLTATADIFSTGKVLTLTATGKEQYVAINPTKENETTDFSYWVGETLWKEKKGTKFEAKKIYNLGDLLEGKYFIVAKKSEDGTYWGMKYDSQSDYRTAESSEKTAYTTYEDLGFSQEFVWNIAKVEGKDTYHISNHDNSKYIKTVADDNKAYVDATNKEEVTITKDAKGFFTIQSNTVTTRFLEFNASSTRFAFYKGTQNGELYLVPVTGKIKSNLTMSFSGDVTLEVGEEFTAPTLTFTPNGTYDVEYSVEGSIASVENNVVKVDTSAAGTATVTATFAGNDDYNPATATYTITVKEAQPGGGESVAETKTITYTVTSTSAVSKTGVAPDGASATYSSTYSDKYQLTSGHSMTLTLSGYNGVKITGLTMSMKSNTSKGGGSYSMKVGTTTISSITGAKFNTSSWNNAWSTSYVDIKPAVTPTTVGANENIVITIAATENSLYCQSFTLTYEVSGGSDGSETPDPKPTQLATPTNLQVVTKELEVSLEWDGSANATSYYVTCGDKSTTVTTTEALFTMDAAGTYDIKVVAKAEGYTDSDALTGTANVTVSTGGGEDTTKYYVKVTSAPSDWSGTYLIVYEASTTKANVFSCVDAANGNVSATISDGKIEATDAMNKVSVVIAKSGTNYSIKINSNAASNANKYIYGTLGSNKLNFNTSAQANTITYESNSVKIVSNTSVLRFNAASDNMRFRYFKSASYTGQKAIQLYKLQD